MPHHDQHKMREHKMRPDKLEGQEKAPQDKNSEWERAGEKHKPYGGHKYS